MKRFLVALILVLGIFGSTTTHQQDIALDEKPPITKPTSTDDVI